MTEQQARTIEVMNRLYAAERRSLLPRLAEAEAFVSWASAGEMAVVRRMIEEEHEHLAWLVEAMDRCCGVLYPAGPDIHTGHLHYLDLQTIMPQVVRSLENLIRIYQDAGRHSLAAPASQVISRILVRRQRHLEQLRKMAERSEVVKA